MSDPIVTKVCDLLREREAVGMAKYGVNLTRTDLSEIEWLRHLRSELLDGALYATRRIEDLEAKQ